MSVHRIHKNGNYSTICNEGVNNVELSWEARGLLWYLLSKPDGWEVQTSELEKASRGQGIKVVRRILKELELHQYLVRWRDRGEMGQWKWKSEIFESRSAAKAWLDTHPDIAKKVETLEKQDKTLPSIPSPSIPQGQMADGETVKGRWLTARPSTLDGKRVDIVNTERTITEEVNTEEVNTDVSNKRHTLTLVYPANSETEEQSRVERAIEPEASIQGDLLSMEKTARSGQKGSANLSSEKKQQKKTVSNEFWEVLISQHNEFKPEAWSLCKAIGDARKKTITPYVLEYGEQDVLAMHRDALRFAAQDRFWGAKDKTNFSVITPFQLDNKRSDVRFVQWAEAWASIKSRSPEAQSLIDAAANPANGRMISRLEQRFEYLRRTGQL